MAEEKEEKEGIEWGELFGHAIRFLILTWSLSMMTLGYMGKVRIDGAFTAGTPLVTEPKPPTVAAEFESTVVTLLPLML